jgi:hypothetical protein
MIADTTEELLELEKYNAAEHKWNSGDYRSLLHYFYAI